MHRYRRRLPHWDAPGALVFVTWTLKGSLPRERAFRPEHLTSGRAFATFDRLLDGAQAGPSYLRRPEIATLVRDQLERAHADGVCELDCYVIMPNHVHVLWTPAVSLAVLLRQVKGPTARNANEILGREGQSFWEEEYFDRLVQTADEARRIRLYIAANPVRAGLAHAPEEYLWRG